MNIILKNTIFVLIMVILLWIFVSAIVLSGTFFDKYRCEDFKESGYDVKSDIKVGFLFIPYNRCFVNNGVAYVPHYKITGGKDGN